MLRSASADQPYINISGVAKKGHPFARHGAHLSDKYQFDRAKSMENPVSRWDSFADQEAIVRQVRSKIESPSTPLTDPACPINADGKRAIDNRTLTIDDILNNPLAYSTPPQKYLKSIVEYKKQPAGKVIGKEFDPDRATIRDVDHVTVVFELDNTGKYQLLTAFPERP